MAASRKSVSWIGIAVVAVLALVGLNRLTGVKLSWPGLHNPVTTEERERIEAGELGKLRLEGKLHVATRPVNGVKVEIERRTKLDFGVFDAQLPRPIAGQDLTVLAYGQAYYEVDFAKLPENGVVIDPATNTVTYTVPNPRVDHVALDEDKTEKAGYERGALDGLGAAFMDNWLEEADAHDEALTKMEKQAKADEEGLAKAQAHLEQWLTRFGKAHGYETVTVVFAA